MRTLSRLPFCVLLLAGLAVALGAAGAATADAPQGLRGEYFADPDLGGAPLATRIDPAIDFDWGLSEPYAGLGDDFGVRWTGTIRARFSERYTFFTRADDGVRLWVDGRLVVDDWTRHELSEHSGTIDLAADRPTQIKLEYDDRFQRARVHLDWQSASQQREVVPASRLSPAGADLPAAAGRALVPGPGDPAAPAIIAPAAQPVLGPARGPFDPPATPVAGATFNAAPIGGEVLVRRPEDGRLLPLDQAASLPVGTRVDAREGVVWVQTAPAAGVTLPAQHAQFVGAMFEVDQPRRGSRIVDIDLEHGDFESCPPARATRTRRAKAARAASRSRSAHSVRSVWGSGKGRFRTRGRYGAATVRGTVWNVEDRCDSTVVRVREGIVDVDDLVSGRTVSVHAGGSYTARSRRTR